MKHGRRDANHRAIRDGLRQLGWSVVDLGDVGGGCPDLLCGCRGLNLLLEVKTDTGELSDEQHDWHGAWTGQVAVVRSLAEAVEVLTWLTNA